MSDSELKTYKADVWKDAAHKLFVSLATLAIAGLVTGYFSMSRDVDDHTRRLGYLESAISPAMKTQLEHTIDRMSKTETAIGDLKKAIDTLNTTILPELERIRRQGHCG